MSDVISIRVQSDSRIGAAPGLQGRASLSAFARLEINSDEQMVEDSSILQFGKAWVGPESRDLGREESMHLQCGKILEEHKYTSQS